MKINVNGVSITLTKEQLLEIKKQTEEDIFSCTSYSEVCRRLNKDEEDCPYKTIKDIERYFAQGWKPNWRNTNEYKYIPYFSVSSGGGLVCCSFNCYHSSFGGSVAFYKSIEIAEFVGKNFIKEYQNLRDYNC